LGDGGGEMLLPNRDQSEFPEPADFVQGGLQHAGPVDRDVLYLGNSSAGVSQRVRCAWGKHCCEQPGYGSVGFQSLVEDLGGWCLPIV
jgi:hypothetical protein